MFLHLPLLYQHHCRVWTVNGGIWCYCVNTTVVYGLWMEAFDAIVSTPLSCVDREWRQLTLLCQYQCRVWTLNGGSWHYCVNTTVVCGLWMEEVDTIVSTPLSCVDSEWRQLTLLFQHHCRVWTVNGGNWHYCVNITDVCGGGLCVAAHDTIVSTPLLYMNCNWHQFTLGFFVGFVLLDLLFSVKFFVHHCLSFCLFHFGHCVLLPITVSIYPFGICKTVLSPYHYTQYFGVSMRLLEYHTIACSVYNLLNVFTM